MESKIEAGASRGCGPKRELGTESKLSSMIDPPQPNRWNWKRVIKRGGVLLALYALSFGPVFYVLYLLSLGSIGYLLYFPILMLGGLFPALGSIVAWYADLWTDGPTARFLWPALVLAIAFWLKVSIARWRDNLSTRT